MGIGGAQTTARLLCHLPDANVSLACYDAEGIEGGNAWDWILLHTWCSSPEGQAMMSPPTIPRNSKLAVFTHDWRGNVCFKADVYLCYSRYAQSLSHFDGPVHVVGAGLDLTPYGGPARDNGHTITVGRLSTLYGGKISVPLLQYWQDINADAFVCAGDGYERPALMAAFASDSRFTFPGEIQPINVPGFLRSIDIFLYDTVWHTESFCYVVLEAMAAGCVVVTRPRGALAEICHDKVNSFHFTTERECVDLCNWLIRSPDIRLRISEAARGFAGKYTSSAFLQNVRRILSEESLS